MNKTRRWRSNQKKSSQPQGPPMRQPPTSRSLKDRPKKWQWLMRTTYKSSKSPKRLSLSTCNYLWFASQKEFLPSSTASLRLKLHPSMCLATSLVSRSSLKRMGKGFLSKQGFSRCKFKTQSSNRGQHLLSTNLLQNLKWLEISSNFTMKSSKGISIWNQLSKRGETSKINLIHQPRQKRRP